MINENRRQEIMQRLKEEREQRKRLVQEGQTNQYLDRSLLQTPSIGKPEYSDTQSEIENIPITGQSTPAKSKSSILDQQRDKLQEMKQNLFKKKQEKEFSYIDRLAEPKTVIQEEREHIRLEKEKQMLSELPFQPQIGEQSKLLAQLKYTKFEGLPIYDRLQKLEQERQNHVVELRLMVNQQEEEEPEQKPPRPYSDKPPLYERYQQVMEEKKTHLLELKAKQKEAEAELYKPKINQQSQLLAEIRYEGQNVVDRLVQDGIRKQNTIYPDDLPFDFQPYTNAVINDQIVKGDFTQRQEEFTKKQLEKNMELESRAYQAYTFKPQVNKASEKMLVDRKISQDSLFDRLYSEYQSRQSHIQEKKDEELSKMNFNPELNSKSMQMAVDRTLDDLIKNEYGEYRKQLLKEKYDDSDKECSFYPSVSTSMKYSQMHSQYSFDDCHEKIKQYQSEKEQRRSQLKKQQESDELKECTFKPQTNKTMVDPRKKIEVYGLESFMLKVDMAKKQKDEQEQVAQKLFNKHEQYDQTKHKEKTDIRPFNLSSNRSAKNSYKKHN